jgi:hypothetical protein
MAALTLSGGVGEWAVQESAPIMLMQAGQKVSIKPGAEINPADRGVALEVAEVVGDGDDAFVSVKRIDGSLSKWYRAIDLAPAMINKPGASDEDEEKDPVTGQPKKNEADTPAGDPKPGEPKPPVDPNKPATPAVAGDPNAAVKTPEELQAEHAEKEAKKALAGIVGVAVAQAILQKGMSMSQTFKLSTNTGEIEVTAEQLQKAGITIVPDGAVVVQKTEVEGLKEQVTNLSSQVASLSTAALANQKTARDTEVKLTLDRLSREGKLTRPMRSWAEGFFKDAVDLTAFKSWAAAQTSVIKLDDEVGHGGNAPTDGEQQPSNELLTLATTMAKAERISLRDAIVKVSAEHPELAETYRESFAADDQKVSA